MINILIIEKVKINEKIYHLLDYEKPDNNYILLESLSKERAEKRFAYIICFQDTSEIKIVIFF